MLNICNKVKSKKLSYINGFLGTVVVHLLVGIIFFSAKITGIHTAEVQVEVVTPEVVKEEAVQKEKLVTDREKQEQMQKMQDRVDAFILSQKRRNVGVNMSGKEPSTADIDQIRTEIEGAQKQIASVQENLDKQRNKPEPVSDDKGEVVSTKHTEKIQGKLAVYKGPTNIYFDLANRRDVYLYVPVYKCQGLGRVVVLITVSADGSVESAKVNKEASDNDECLHDAAYDAALRSRFTKDLSGKAQKGSITYLFVAQ